MKRSARSGLTHTFPLTLVNICPHSYYEDPVLDADCITCKDGSEVKPQYMGGTGLCGRDISKDVPCLAEEYDLSRCLSDNSAECSECPLQKFGSEEDDFDLSCSRFFEELCTSDECCPSCALVSRRYAKCMANLPPNAPGKEHVLIDIDADCVITECSPFVPDGCIRRPGTTTEAAVTGNCTCHESCGACG